LESYSPFILLGNSFWTNGIWCPKVSRLETIEGLSILTHYIFPLHRQEKLTAFFVVKRNGYSLGDPHLFQESLTPGWTHGPPQVQEGLSPGYGGRLSQEEIAAFCH